MKKEFEVVFKFIDNIECIKHIYCFKAFVEFSQGAKQHHGEWKQEVRRILQSGSDQEKQALMEKKMAWKHKREHLKELIFHNLKKKIKVNMADYSLEWECINIDIDKANMTGAQTHNPHDLEKCNCCVRKVLKYCRHDATHKICCHYNKMKTFQVFKMIVDVDNNGFKLSKILETRPETKEKFQKMRELFQGATEVSVEEAPLHSFGPSMNPSMTTNLTGGGTDEWESKYYKYKMKYWDLRNKLQ